MNEQILTHEFATAVRAEPPLGFDPDEVITRTARRRRGRRKVLLAGAGVVVALAAVAVPLTRTPAAVPARPAVAPKPATPPADRLWPPDGVQVPQPAVARLKNRELAIAAHLEEMLPTVVPGVPRRESTDSGRYGSVQPNSLLGVRVTESIGGVYLTVEVYVPAAPVKRFTPRQHCDELKKQVSATTTCRYADDGTGGVLMTTEDDTVDRENAKQHGITVSYFRADGTYVLATAGNAVGTSAPPPLTAQQLTALATDPALML